MNIVCFDMEGTLTPEIWIAFAEAVGIPELKRTTKDEPDYDKLMQMRLGILAENGFTLSQIQEVIAGIDPLPGAKEMLDELRQKTQICIISDTFEQFAKPLMAKLGWPLLFCNTLEIDENDRVVGYRMRCEQSKLTTVNALQAAGVATIAVGDSFNDLGMILASQEGFLLHANDALKAEYPQVPAFDTYEELMAALEPAITAL